MTDPLTEQMDEVEEEQEKGGHQEDPDDPFDVDVEDFIESLDEEGQRTATVGIAVTPQLLHVWKELQKPKSEGGTDADVIQLVRDQMMNYANRNKDTVERAARRYKFEQQQKQS